MPLRFRSIKARLIAAFLSVVVLFGFAGIVATFSAHSVRSSLSGRVAADDGLIQQALQLRRLVGEQHAAVRGYLLTGSPLLLWPYNTAIRSLKPVQAALTHDASAGAIAPLRARVESVLNNWEIWARAVSQNTNSEDILVPRPALTLSAGERVYHDYNRVSTRLLHTLAVDRRREVGSSADLLARIEIVIPVIFACGLALAAVLWWWMMRAVSRPLDDLCLAADAVGQGNLARPVQIGGADEFRVLSGSMERMRRRLKHQYDELHSLNRALEVSQKRFRAIVDKAAIGVSMADSEGRFVETNRAFQDMLGYSAEELLALRWSDITHPADVGTDLAANAKLFRGGPDHIHGEKRYLRKDGGIVWVRMAVSLLRDADGRPEYTIAMIEDVTEQRRAEEALRARESEIRDMQMGVLVFDHRGRIIRANPAATALFGVSSHDMHGRSSEDTTTPLLREDYSYLPPEETPIARALITGEPVRGAVVGLVPPGTEERVWVLVNADPQLGENGKVERVVCTCADITERKRLEEQLRHLALHDALTGLPNRCLLHDRLDQALSTARRRRSPVSLLLLDLDRFKEVNDTFGHRYGDVLLQELGERLQEALRGSDTLARLGTEEVAVARLGGDEFATVLIDTPVSGGLVVAEKILESLREPFAIEGELLDVTTSIGIATYPEHGEDAETLLRHADVAMYTAKREHSGCMVYDPLADPYNPVRAGLIRDLRQAIDREELQLHFQPKAELATRRVVGVEGLVRWRHKQYGWVPPLQIIALAEHTGLIKGLSAWVLRAAVRQWRQWSDAGLDLCVQVNLSARSLHDPQIVGSIEGLLEEHIMPPCRLGIEITESSVMADPERALRILQGLDALGIAISIDDFGTGYSSLRYLKDMPAHEVKIDRSFVSDAVHNEHDLRIVRGTIALAHDLGLRTVAEGIEHEETWQLLNALGCDLAQGFHLARAMPADELVLWLRERHTANVA